MQLRSDLILKQRKKFKNKNIGAIQYMFLKGDSHISNLKTEWNTQWQFRSLMYLRNIKSHQFFFFFCDHFIQSTLCR